MNNYPPGVSGNELNIAGPDSEVEWCELCGECGEDNVWWWTYRKMSCLTCDSCGKQVEDDYIDDRGI